MFLNIFSQAPFGGMQVIVIGDFYQLPPVPNPPYGDLGLPAYESPAWRAISHTVVLREVMRQTENELIKVKIGTVEMKELIIMIFIPLT